MTDDDRTARNRSMLQQCHPVFRHRLATVLAEMQAAGYRPRIQQAWRSPADQLVAFNTGHSELRWGMHNCTAPDGTPEALAADVLDDDHPLNPSRAFLFVLAREAQANILLTGIDWGLPIPMKIALISSLHHGVTWEGKIGFDPTHCQVADVTVAQAKAGIRPIDPPAELTLKA